MSTWVKAGNYTPKEGVAVFVMTDKGGSESIEKAVYNGEFWVSRNGDKLRPDWYMPIPEVANVDRLVNVKVESALVGAIMLDPVTVFPARRHILPDDLHDIRHQAIFNAMLDVVDTSRRPSLENVEQQLVRSKMLDLAGGTEYLAELRNVAKGRGMGSTIDVPSWAEHLCQLSQQRAYREVCTRGLTLTTSVVENMEDLWSAATDSILKAQERRLNDYSPIADTASAVRDQFAAWAAGESPELVLTGIKSLDHMIGGLPRGEVTALGARPGQGKTLLGTIMAQNVADAGGKVAVSSLEMSAKQIAMRLVCRDARVDPQAYRRGDYRGNDEVEARIHKAIRKHSQSNMLVNDDSFQTGASMHYAAQIMKLEGGLDLHVVDYAELVAGDSETSDQEALRIAQTWRREKALVKSTGAAGVMLSQLKKSADGRLPIAADLRYGGTAEAALIMGLFWSGQYVQNNPGWDNDGQLNTQPDSYYVNVSKNRYGRAGTVLLRIIPQISDITDHPETLKQQEGEYIG